MVDYLKSFGQSWKDLIANPILIVPFLMQPAALILIFILSLIAGAAVLLPQMGITLSTFSSADSFLTAISAIAWTPALITSIVAVSLIICIILFVIYTWFMGGTLAMVNDVADGKKTGSATFFTGARQLFKQLIILSALQGLFYLVAALPLIIFIFLAIFRAEGRIVFIVFAVLCGLMFIAVALLISVALLFAQPILVRERVPATEAIRRSAALLRDRTSHVLLTFVTSIGITFAISIALSILTLPISMLADARPESFGLQAASMVVSLIQNVIYVVVGIVASIFLFRMCKEIEITSSAPKKQLSGRARTRRMAS